MILATKHCVPCKGIGRPLTKDEIAKCIATMDHNWHVTAQGVLQGTYKFKNFEAALHFVNQIGSIANQENHHPDIHLSWGKVVVELTTHALKGLTENDFIIAQKIDLIPN